MTKTTSNQQRARAEFLGTILEIGDVLDALRDETHDHLGVAPHEVTWTSVGDAQRILAALRETLAIARHENH